MSEIETESDTLHLKRIASLSQDELRDWIRALLLGQGVESFGDAKQGVLPHYVVASLYPELDRDSRTYVRQIVVGFLWEMARDEQSCWKGEPAHALLMLAQMLEEPEFIEPIQEMAEAQNYFAADETDPADDIHHRLLQSLVMLSWLGTIEFWNEQFALAPERYAATVFAGLTQIALQSATALLPKVNWDSEDVQDRMEIALRGLLPEYRLDQIGKAIEQVIPELPASAIGFIKEYLPEAQQYIEDYSSPEQALAGMNINLMEVMGVLRENGYESEPRSLEFAVR